MDNGSSKRTDRIRNGDLAVPGRFSPDCRPPGLHLEGCEEVLGPSSRVGSYGGSNEGISGRTNPPGRATGTGAKKIMSLIFKTTREWWLVGICLILLMTQFFPQAIEIVYPIIDWRGGNRLNMQVSKDMAEGKFYKCGEMVLARVTMQKQREAVGTVQWKLVGNDPGGNAYTYPPKTISAHIGIIDNWTRVEKLPDVCSPGQYHFEGTMVYPVTFGTVIYTIRTTCFTVRGK